MKKSIFAIILILFMVPMALALNGNGANSAGKQNYVTESGKSLDSFQEINGLEKATIQFKNENVLQNMVKNMNQIREQNQERFMNCEENCKIEAEEKGEGYEVKIQRKSQFLWWEVNAEQIIEFDSEYKIQNQKQNIWQNLVQNNVLSYLDK